MNVQRATIVETTYKDLRAALRLLYPTSLDVQRLPVEIKAGDTVNVTPSAGKGLKIVYLPKPTYVEAAPVEEPAPVE